MVAALDSVVGLCSGIESNISKNKDTQSYVHSDFKSSAFGMMSQEERDVGEQREQTYWLSYRYADAHLFSAMQNKTVQELKGCNAECQHEGVRISTTSSSVGLQC